MTTLTLSPDPGRGRMRVVVDGGAGGRLERDGQLVRGAGAVTGDRVVDDYEIPLGRQVTYRLDGATATGRLDTTTAWLTHPTDPTLSVPVTVRDDDPVEYSIAGVAITLLGDSDPVWTHTRRRVRAGTIEILSSWAERDRIDDLLLDGSPLLLRAPAGCLVDDGWVAITNATRRKVRADHTALRWVLDTQRCAPPGGIVTIDPVNTWAGVAVQHPTWADVVAWHSTWIDVALTAHPHEVPR